MPFGTLGCLEKYVTLQHEEKEMAITHPIADLPNRL